MDITSEIFQVGGPGVGPGNDAAVYLLRFGEDAALVDAGCGPSAPAILDRVRGHGAEPGGLKYLLITHCHFDHTGGAAHIRRATGCKTVAHDREADFLESGDDAVSAALWYGASLTPVPVDVRLGGAEAALTLGDRAVHALHIPGHSPGSVAYWVESDGQRVLFGQDVHGPLDAALLSDAAAYRASLETLAALEADVLCEGHYGIFRGRETVRDFIRSFL